MVNFVWNMRETWLSKVATYLRTARNACSKIRHVYFWNADVRSGKKIDTQISWPWKHVFAWKIVLRVIVFVASLPYLRGQQVVTFAHAPGLLESTYWREIVIAESGSEALLRAIFLHTQSTVDMPYRLDTLVKPCWSVMYERRTI